MKRISKIVLLSAALWSLTVGLSAQINTRVNAAAVARPFHAVIQGNANPSFIDPCTIQNHETASGTALHLGRITLISDEIAAFVPCPPPTLPAIIEVTGHFTMTAANGDQIQGDYHTTGTFDPVAGVSVSGKYTFKSGTGRFSNVSGTGVITANGGAAPPFEVVGSFDGTINY
jgi:hypothetical protein